MPALRPLSLVLCLLLALLAGPGCSHYQLGTGTPGKLTFSTLYIEPVENKTLLPQARTLLSTQLRAAFARDARITLVNSPEAADATLAITITAYRRDILTVREGDTGLARKFNVTLTTAATLRDAPSKSTARSSPTVASCKVNIKRCLCSPSPSPPKLPTPPSTCGE